MSIEERLTQIETNLDQINERNKRVEMNKAWETSMFRTVSIMILTYILTALVFLIIGVKNFLLNALIPTIAYTISTLTLPLLRKFWINRQGK